MDAQSQQNATDAITGLGIGFMIFAFVLVLALLVFTVFLLWRIFTKAGLSGALSLLIFVPFIGTLIVLCVLAFADWRVIPAPSAVYLPPSYPPPPGYTPPPPPYNPGSGTAA